MSLRIEEATVAEVLLADNEWYSVDDSTFTIDAYEFMHEGDRTAGAGVGFEFTTTGASFGGTRRIAGPLSSILAVRTKS